jgi:uncharacterized protein (TIGR00297 family)
MQPFSITATLLATLMASMLAWRAHRRKSLTPAASVAAFAVGFLLIWTGLRGFNLLVFYFVAMQATKYKKDLKAKIDGTIATQGTAIRGVSQVLACSLLATLLSLWHAMACGAERPIQFTVNTATSDVLASQLTCAIIAHHATCLADTLASELGILNKNPPVLITQPWKQVPSGTNGGVSWLGFVWSALGGGIIGISTVLLDLMSGVLAATTESHLSQAATRIVVFSTCCGLLGSILDSLLGATLQQSFYDPDSKMVFQEEDKRPEKAKLVAGVNLLTNELVNVVSVALTCLLGGWVLGPMIFAS